MAKEMINITSSTGIISATYESSIKYLTVTFKTGKSYGYSEVPIEVWNSFKEATSKGSFFSRNIKNKYKM